MKTIEMTTWLEKLTADGRSPHTVTGYARALDLFSDWHAQTYGDAEFKPAKVIPKDFKDWVSRQQSVERAKPATINQRVAAVRKFFAWLHENGHLTKNPAAEAKFLGTDKAEFKGLEENYYRQLSRAVYLDESLRDIAIFEAMAGAGLRVSEVLDLQVGDLVIRERDTRDNFSYIIVREGKGSKRRTVPMSKTVKSAFSNYIKTHPEPTRPQAKLWSGQRGALSSPSGIHKMLVHYARVAKIPDEIPVHAHTLRHTFAYLFLKKYPGDIRTLADLLGHNDLKQPCATPPRPRPTRLQRWLTWIKQMTVRNPNVDLVTVAAFHGHSRPNAEDLEKAARSCNRLGIRSQSRSPGNKEYTK